MALEKAPKELMIAVIKCLRDLQVPIHDGGGLYVNLETIQLIASAVVSHFKEAEGTRMVLREMKFIEKPGNAANKYMARNGFGQVTKEIPPEHLTLIQGLLYRGKPIPIDSVEVKKRDVKACEDCGILAPCIKMVKNYSGGRELLKDSCNHCRFLSDQPAVRDTASSSVCKLCTQQLCEWHPGRENKFIEHKGQILPPTGRDAFI